MSKTVLLTGGCGFIGHHTVEHILKTTDWNVVVMDRLTYAGNQNFLTNTEVYESARDRIKFVYHDFRSPISEKTADLIGDVDYVIHMGAESHVDRSLVDPIIFAESNVIGTVNILNYLLSYHDSKRLIYISTDEVYGPSIDGHLHKEGEPHRPSNPYSASKSGAEAFVYSFFNSYGLDLIVTNTMNNFGERQNKEKFVPRAIRAAIYNDTLTYHCKIVDGEVVDVSSRCWLHARNHADGILFVLQHGIAGERYNITGEKRTVQEIGDMVGLISGKKINYRFEDFHSFRPGHDMHYGLDGSKLEGLGWIPPLKLFESLEHTVQWTLKHPEWL